MNYKIVCELLQSIPITGEKSGGADGGEVEAGDHRGDEEVEDDNSKRREETGSILDSDEEQRRR